MTQQLLTNFYTELSSTYQANVETFASHICLNPVHEIYKGHFPQMPIAPGVVLVQIIKEIIESKLQKQLRLTEGDNIKFLALINPNETSELQLSITIKQQNTILDVKAEYTGNQKSYTKFKGRFKIVR